jgi:hypothetical protein
LRDKSPSKSPYFDFAQYRFGRPKKIKNHPALAGFFISVVIPEVALADIRNLLFINSFTKTEIAGKSFDFAQDDKAMTLNFYTYRTMV